MLEQEEMDRMRLSLDGMQKPQNGMNYDCIAFPDGLIFYALKMLRKIVRCLLTLTHCKTKRLPVLLQWQQALITVSHIEECELKINSV